MRKDEIKNKAMQILKEADDAKRIDKKNQSSYSLYESKMSDYDNLVKEAKKEGFYLNFEGCIYDKNDWEKIRADWNDAVKKAAPKNMEDIKKVEKETGIKYSVVMCLKSHFN